MTNKRVEFISDEVNGETRICCLRLAFYNQFNFVRKHLMFRVGFIVFAVFPVRARTEETNAGGDVLLNVFLKFISQSCSEYTEIGLGTDSAKCMYCLYVNERFFSFSCVVSTR